MVDIQIKILDIQAASPIKHSLYIKNEDSLLKKVWPGTAITTISDTEANSSKFQLKLGTNAIGEIPLIEFTKDWIHGSKEILGYRISLAYRILLKKPQNSQDILILQEKLKASQNNCQKLTEKLQKLSSYAEILDLYTQALDNFKAKEQSLRDKIDKIKKKKKIIKESLKEAKNDKEKTLSELWIVKEELSLEKLKNKAGIVETQNIGSKDENDTGKSENSFRFSFGPEGGSEDFDKNLEALLIEILNEKGIEINLLQVSTGVFYIGKIRVQVKIENGNILAYYNKNYISIEEFLDMHFKQESKGPRRSLSAGRFMEYSESPVKLNTSVRNLERQGKAVNNSMKIVQDIGKVIDYSGSYRINY